MLHDESQYPRLPISPLRKAMAQPLDRTFHMHGVDITTEQELVLRTLRRVDKLSQTELASYTGQDRNNLSRTVAILERKGLVKKLNSKQDRRYCQIHITAKGEAVHRKVWDVLEAWRMQLFKDIPVDELKQFTAVAEKLIHNIQVIDAEPLKK